MTSVPDPKPVVFGPDGGQMFGWYHPPAVPDGAGRWRDCLVLMCNPIGYDAICTYRHYRLLAMRLAEAGFAVLRYDHAGTGDSAGGDEDPARVQAWTDGVSSAMAAGLRYSGATRASLFGVRMGATLALAAVAAGGAAARAGSVVAWAPFSSGNLYLREARAMRMMRSVDGSQETLAGPDESPAGEESGGYLMTPPTLEALAAMDLTTLATADNLSPREVLMLQRDDIPQNGKLTRHLEKIGCPVTTTEVGGYAAMMRDTFDAVVPEAALTEIREWLEQRHALQAGAPAAAVDTGDAVIPTRGAGGVEVRDTPLRFGAHGNLFGILSGPVVPQGERGRTAVVFVSTGSNHHIGPNRMNVAHGRVLAGLGFLSMRLDIGGVGDSPAAPGQRDNHLFARHSLGEVHEAIHHLKSRFGVEKVVLVGLCSGAYLSFRGAVAEPSVGSIVLINPQAFNWREGDSLDPNSRRDIRSLGFYRSRLLDRGTWARVARGDVDVKWIVGGVSKLLRKRVTRGVQAALAGKVALTPEQQQTSTDVLGLFRGLLQRRVQVFMVFSANDGGLDEVQTYLGERASRIRGPEHFRFEVVAGADHTFTPIWAQKRLCDLLTDHVVAVYG